MKTTPVQATRCPRSMSEEEALSKVQQITAASETIEVGGVEFEIEPMDNDEFLSYVTNDRNKNVDEQEVMVDLVTDILQKDDPSITREDIKQAPMELTVKVLDAIEQVNGLEDFLSKAGNQGEKTPL